MWKHHRWYGIAILAATMMVAGGIGLAADEPGPSARLIPTSRVSPVYPPAAFAARFDGEITLAALVRADGKVGEIEVLDSTRPNLGFEQASKAAVQKWLFEPAELDGEAVDSYAVFRLSFGIDRVGQERSAMVVGTFLQGGTFPGISGQKGADGRAGGGNRTTSAELRTRLQEVNLPPACLGCLYDRTSLIPRPMPAASH